jgi:hypothetical protein
VQVNWEGLFGIAAILDVIEQEDNEGKLLYEIDYTKPEGQQIKYGKDFNDVETKRQLEEHLKEWNRKSTDRSSDNK